MEEKFELECGGKKAFKPATYKQIEYLKSFNNVTISTSSSQIMKRLNSFELSEAIDAAKEGKKVYIL